MTGDLLDRLTALDVEYAQFNAVKTVADARPSMFSVARVGPLTVTSDPAREGAYYNRIIGLSAATLPWLDRAIERFAGGGPAPRIDIDAQDFESVDVHLRQRGFLLRQGLLWLTAPTGARPPSIPVTRLVTGEADRILPLLELEGPIDPTVWADRRGHHCTAGFRAFVIEVDAEVVAMATTFVGAHGAVLGNALTREDCRQRGYQQALIAARLADAADLGLDLVVTDVEPETTSSRNCKRAGFTTVREQMIWERAWKKQSRRQSRS